MNCTKPIDLIDCLQCFKRSALNSFSLITAISLTDSVNKQIHFHLLLHTRAAFIMQSKENKLVTVE